MTGFQQFNWLAPFFAAKKLNPFELTFSLLRTVTANELLRENLNTHAYARKKSLRANKFA